MRSPTIHLCLFAYQAHLPYAATTVASVCRRTRRQVHARVYVGDGELPEAFSAGNLTVEFARPAHPLDGGMLLSHVNPCVFDHLDIVDDATDWDRCWILDNDQIVIGDPGEYYDMGFGGAWMAGRIWRTVAETVRVWFGHDWPEDAPGGDLPVPFFGILCDLAAMREGGFTAAFREAAQRWQTNGQLAAAVAVAGRIRETGNEWNQCLGGAGHNEAGVPGDLEWGCHPARVLHWNSRAKPWDDPSLPGAQLWLRELTDWDELKHELFFRERDRHKVPAFLIHLAGAEESGCDTAGALEDAGFALELARACNPAYPLHLRGSVGLILEWFGWQATRSNIARVLSHRWAWQAFLDLSDAPFAMVCEDGVAWQGTEAEMRGMCDGRGSGPWLVDLAGEVGDRSTGWKPVRHDRPEAYHPDGRAYCLSRETARLLLEREYCHARALANPHDPADGLSIATSPKAWATGPSALETLLPNLELAVRPEKILVGICSCRQYADKRQAVRETWFPHGVPGVEAVFFVGDGDHEILEPDTDCVAAPDTYDDLPAKVLAFFRHALEHYKFDWLFKCDDDTYLAADRLHGLLDHRAEHVGNYFVNTRGAADGGAGYLLSRRLVEIIAADSSLALTGPEDVIIGLAAIGTGESHASDGRLIRTMFPMPRWDNHLITCHRLSPHDLHTVHALMEPPHNLIEVDSGNDADDHILLHRHNRYSRKVAPEAGTYEWREDARQLILHRPYRSPVMFEITAGNMAASPAAVRSGPSTAETNTRPESPVGKGSKSSLGDSVALHPEATPVRSKVSHASSCDGGQKGGQPAKPTRKVPHPPLPASSPGEPSAFPDRPDACPPNPLNSIGLRLK